MTDYTELYSTSSKERFLTWQLISDLMQWGKVPCHCDTLLRGLNLELSFLLPYQQDFAQLLIDSHIYPTPPLGQDMTQGQFLSGV